MSKYELYKPLPTKYELYQEPAGKVEDYVAGSKFLQAPPLPSYKEEHYIEPPSKTDNGPRKYEEYVAPPGKNDTGPRKPEEYQAPPGKRVTDYLGANRQQKTMGKKESWLGHNLIYLALGIPGVAIWNRIRGKKK